MRSTKKCPWCDYTLTAHGNGQGLLQWDHEREKHPEKIKEQKVINDQIRALQKQMREQYGWKTIDFIDQPTPKRQPIAV